MRMLISAACAAAVMAAGAAKADTFDLSYDFPSTGNTLMAVLGGTAEGDNNTFDVTSVNSVSVNGTPVAISLTPTSLDYQAGLSSSDDPKVTVDGSFLDINAQDSTGGSRFAFAVNDQLSSFLGNSAEASSNLGGNGSTATFEPGSYSGRIVSGNGGGGGGGPEPSTWALMMLGVFGVGAALRRRQRPMLAFVT